jgi:hypothetical protein
MYTPSRLLLLFPVPTTYTPSRLFKRLRHAGYDTDTRRGACIGSRSFVLGSRSCVRAGRNEDSDDCTGLDIYLYVYVHWCVPLSAFTHICIYIHIFIYIYIAHSRPPCIVSGCRRAAGACLSCALFLVSFDFLYIHIYIHICIHVCIYTYIHIRT